MIISKKGYSWDLWRFGGGILSFIINLGVALSSFLNEASGFSCFSNSRIIFCVFARRLRVIIGSSSCNVRMTSIVTNAPLEITPRKSDDPHANCLFFAKGTCKKCAENCPAGAITEEGHDKNKCYAYGQKISRKMNQRIGKILKPHWRMINGEYKEQQPPVGCAFCQFQVPCMDKNPVKL